jgi:CheY-like chemotaxis protein
MMAKVAHEMRNHINVISGWVQLLERHFDRATVDEALPAIKEAVAQLSQLVERFAAARNVNGDRATSAPAPEANGTSLRGKRVLVVDDEPDARILAKLLLEEAGAEVQAAADTEAALALVKSWMPDVLVSDLGMPLADGFALLEALRKLRPEEGGTTPAVALTGFVKALHQDRTARCGFDAYVCKPYDAAELVGAVARLSTGSEQCLSDAPPERASQARQPGARHECH